MPGQQNDPKTFPNQAMEMYLRETYVLYFRENMQAAFPGMSPEDIDAAYNRQKTYSDTAWDLFKKVLYQQLPLDEARQQIRRQDDAITEDNWLACEALTLRHLMKFSDPTSTTPEIWRSFETIVQAHYRPYEEKRNPGSEHPLHSVPPRAETPGAPETAGISITPMPTATAVDILNQALAFSLEWGENFGKPIYERMRRVFPHIQDVELEAIQQACDRIKSVAWQAYEDVYVEKTSGNEAHRRLLEIFPGIDERNLSMLASQGMYYAWRG